MMLFSLNQKLPRHIGYLESLNAGQQWRFSPGQMARFSPGRGLCTGPIEVGTRLKGVHHNPAATMPVKKF